MHILGVFLSLFKFSDEEQEEVRQHGQRYGPNYKQLNCTRAGPTKDLTSFNGEPLWAVDHARIKVGKGGKDYEATKKLLLRWEQFQLGWAQVQPSTKVEEGAPVCVVAQPLFVWVANPLRIMYVDEGHATAKRSASVNTGAARPSSKGPAEVRLQRFQFAQGCMHGHLLAGEERFAVEWDKSDDSVWFEIFTISRPSHPLSLAAYPVLRWYQHRFRKECVARVAKLVEAAQ